MYKGRYSALYVHYAGLKKSCLCKIRGRQVNFSSCSGQVRFSVSIDINYSEQKFAKETFKHLPYDFDFALIWVVFR